MIEPRESQRAGPTWLAWSALPEESARRLDEGGSALEIGCGSGYGCLAVAERFPAVAVTGHDRDPAAIARARGLAAAAGLEARVCFEVDDSLRLPRSSMEVIVAVGALERRDAARLLNAIRNALVSEGVCLLVSESGADGKARALGTAAGFSRLRRLQPRLHELRR
jgi:cyclopropane fatty-acyl-phospholipid synthase-like methyltransferase